MIQFQESCIGCGKCAWDCFPGAIEMENGKPLLNNPGACIGCGHCIAICPRNAVFDDTLGDSFSIEKGPDSHELLSLMRSRRACRHFQDKAVSEDDLMELLEAARACPTAMNLQGTRYIAVTEHIPQLLDLALEGLGKVGAEIRRTSNNPGMLRRARNFVRWAEQHKTDPGFDPLFFHAPLLLLFVSNEAGARDAAAAAAYTELMAAAKGLGCLYSGYFTACSAENEEIQKALRLDPGEQVVRCLVLGHPDVRFQRTAPKKPVKLTRF